jgi:hypothetical protein
MTESEHYDRNGQGRRRIKIEKYAAVREGKNEEDYPTDDLRAYW